MDSDESYHSESEFYYPDEMTNGNEKENVGAISNEENQQISMSLGWQMCKTTF